MKSDSTSWITFNQNVSWSKSSSINDATLENDVAFNCKMYDANTHKIMKYSFIRVLLFLDNLFVDTLL